MKAFNSGWAPLSQAKDAMKLFRKAASDAKKAITNKEKQLAKEAARKEQASVAQVSACGSLLGTALMNEHNPDLSNGNKNVRWSVTNDLISASQPAAVVMPSERCKFLSSTKSWRSTITGSRKHGWSR